MKDSSKYISTQIKKDIPQFIRIEYPEFVNFIVKYYEWMETQGNPYHFIANTLNFSDVDRTSLELLNEFGKNFLQPLPDLIYDQNNIATLVKNIEQYYSARGSEKAFQFLFRLFKFKDDDIKDLEFYYPSYDMLRISDGKWVNEKSLKIIDPPDDVIDWEAGEITGRTSGAKAIIEEVKVYQSSSGVNIAELFLLDFDVIHYADKFIKGEYIDGITINLINFEAITESIFYDVNITDPGKFNVKDQRIQINDSGLGEDARVVVNTTSKGSVNSFVVIDGGSGYQVRDRVYTDITSNNDFGVGAYGSVSSVDVNGSILGVDLTFSGHDYQYIQKVLIDSTNGQDAIIMMESSDIGLVSNVIVRDFGINYDPSSTIITFNTILRVYDVVIGIFIGEKITGQLSNATGIVEYWDKESNVMSIRITSGIFQAGEQFIGSRYGGSGYIYDISLAKGTLVYNNNCICRYAGRYINMDGHISSLKYIQDSYFYQMFSYMLKTSEPKESWKDYIKHVHPAGTIGFSYRDAVSQYFNESYGGFIGPHLETTEYYKFRWDNEQYHGGHIRNVGNTQIKQYADIIIDDISNINNNITEKTDFTFGSEVEII